MTWGGNVDRLVEIFLATLPGRIKAIADAVKKEAPIALIEAAHRLKGSARTLGADRLVDLCLELEQLGKAGNLAGAPALIRVLDESGDLVKKELERDIFDTR